MLTLRYSIDLVGETVAEKIIAEYKLHDRENGKEVL